MLSAKREVQGYRGTFRAFRHTYLLNSQSSNEIVAPTKDMVASVLHQNSFMTSDAYDCPGVARMKARSAVIRGFARYPDSTSLHPGYHEMPDELTTQDSRD